MDNQYKEALKPFLERKKILEKELSDLNIVINGINSLIGNTEIKTLDDLKQETPQKLPEKSGLNFAKLKVQTKKNSRGIKIPLMYASTLKYPAKILFMLNKRDALTVNEIVEEIELIDGIENHDKLFNGITYAASILFKNGVLNAVREGKANRYSLKKEKAINYDDL